MKVQTEGPEIWIIVIFTAFVPIDFTADLPCYTEISNRPTIKKQQNELIENLLFYSVWVYSEKKGISFELKEKMLIKYFLN